MKTREYWLDYLRAFACILVTVGHLLRSFLDAQLLPEGLAVPLLIDLIYCFHVYIFFFCSGYLFQKTGRNGEKRSYGYQLERCIDLMIVYVIFSGVTYVIKAVFSSDVNSAVEYSFLETLIGQPISQMWYLYAISTIYLFAYRMQSERSVYAVSVLALLMKILIGIPAVAAALPLPIHYLCQDMIWFAMGQLFAHKQVELGRNLSVLLASLFLVLFALRSYFDVSSAVLNAVLTLLGILASAGIVRWLTKNKGATSGFWHYVSKYMLQIYLLHTIFAAGIRIVLLKVGVTGVFPHLILGLLFSFAMPVLCAVIAERVKLLNVVFFPVKTIKSLYAEKRT